VVDAIYEELDNGNYVMGVFLDLQKAFDMVQHDVLIIGKLKYYGIRGVANKWLQSYLQNRSQFVKIDSFKSSLKPITCGVPQGSILGPLLFLIYVNDIWRAAPETSVKLFADDTNLFFAGKNLQELSEKTNNELNKLVEWLNTNKLSINFDKTNYCIFRPRKTNETCKENITLRLINHDIKLVHSCRYLGVMIDDALNWKEHIEYIYKKIIKFTSLFYKLREIMPVGVMKRLYFALVYPHLLYGIELYANTCPTYIDQLTKLNNRILRITFREKRTRKSDSCISTLIC